MARSDFEALLTHAPSELSSEVPYVVIRHKKDGAFFSVAVSMMYYSGSQPRTLTTSENSSYTYEGALSHALAELSAMVSPAR